ncbi:MAG: O-antigen ligase family protein [Pseudomonadota bacterium]
MADKLFQFEDDDLLLGTDETAGTSRSASARAFTRLNRRTAGFVVAAAVFAPIPVGLNRPSAWLIFGACVAVWSLGYLLLAMRHDPERELRSTLHPWLFGLAALVPIWALLQAVPFGAIVPWAEQTALSIVPSASAMGALRFCIYILFAFLVLEVANRSDRARWVGWLLFWGVVVHAMWGLFALNVLGDTHFWGEKTAYVGVATGTFINRNSFATFLAMGVCLGLALLMDRATDPKVRVLNNGPFAQRKLEAAVILMAIALVWVALLATSSRLGVAAGAIGSFVVYMAMQLKLGKNLLRAAALPIGVGVVILGVLLVSVGQGLAIRSIFVGGDAGLRLLAYGFTAELIAARPIAGTGMDTFRVAFEPIHRMPLELSHFWDRAHSTYLTHWSELGVIVGTVPIVIGVLAARRLIDVIRRRSKDYALSIAGLGVLITGAVHSLGDFSLEMPANVVMFVAIICLGIAHRAQGNR